MTQAGVCEKKTLEDPLGMLFRRLVPRIRILVHDVPLIEYTDRYFPGFASGLRGRHIPEHASFIYVIFFPSFTRAPRTGVTRRLTSCEAS